MDVADWIVAAPWGAVGIGAAVVAALVTVLAFGRALLMAWRKARRRQRIGEFMLEGQGLVAACQDEKQEAPEGAADEWAAKTENYLAKELGLDYVASFRSGAGLPMGLTVLGSPAHRNLESGLKVRLARLQQLLEELRQ